jgi:iron(III) transport system substrate-binding protein
MLLVVLTGCTAPAHRPQKLTLYCSVQIDWCDLVKTTFERDTGIDVSMIRKSSGEMFAQIWAERRNPKGDVWFGGTGDAHMQAAESKLSEPYRSARIAALHRWAIDPPGTGEYRATGIYMGALGFAYNAEWLAKKGFAAPSSWRDLLRDEFRGEVQMANPNSSGTAYTMLATIVQLFGEEEGFAYLEKLHANVNQYTKSGSAPVRAAGQGETGIGISFLHDAMTEKKAGFPLVLVAPEEGTGFEIGCVSIVHGARHLDSAKTFVDWALSPRAQELAGKVDAFQVPSNKASQIPADAPRVDKMKLIDFDLKRYGTKVERTRLLTKWEKEVKSG